VYSRQYADGANAWLPAVLAATRPAMTEVVQRWIALSGAAGRAR
jgi:hypothetical protein